VERSQRKSYGKDTPSDSSANTTPRDEQKVVILKSAKWSKIKSRTSLSDLNSEEQSDYFEPKNSSPPEPLKPYTPTKTTTTPQVKTQAFKSDSAPIKITSKQINQKSNHSDDEDFALFERAQEKIDKLHGGLKPAYSNGTKNYTPYKSPVKTATPSGSSTGSSKVVIRKAEISPPVSQEAVVQMRKKSQMNFKNKFNLWENRASVVEDAPPKVRSGKSWKPPTPTENYD